MKRKLIIRSKYFTKRIKYNVSSNETPKEKILRFSKEGKNLFFTGDAGTGKSYFIREIYKELSDKIVFKTAYTGIASINIKGMTIHSFSGCGIEIEFDKMIKNIYNNKNALKRWFKCEILIIDEVSMLGKKFFENMEKIARKIKGNNKFFGGIQLILTGDFFQLKPINDEYLFKSEVFINNIRNFFELKQNYRQNDNSFRRILKEVRYGKLSQKTLNKLEERFKIKRNKKNLIKPTILYSTRKNVNIENINELKKLKTSLKTYISKDFVNKTQLIHPLNLREKFFMSLLNKSLYMEKLYLKKGAQVILIKNIDTLKGLVNGTKGIVLYFIKNTLDELVPVVKFQGIDKPVVINEQTLEITICDGSIKTKIRRTQIPLILAWAITIHKCQGLTLKDVEISMKHIFECGQFYVAISRVRELSGLYLKDFYPNNIKVNTEVLEFYKKYFDY
jgi:ATP-dependent DNA helicase PIF1